VRCPAALLKKTLLVCTAAVFVAAVCALMFY
jgi:hypothetical protein